MWVNSSSGFAHTACRNGGGTLFACRLPAAQCPLDRPSCGCPDVEEWATSTSPSIPGCSAAKRSRYCALTSPRTTPTARVSLERPTVAGPLGTDAATMLRDRYPVGAPANQVAAVIAAIPSAVDYAHQHQNPQLVRPFRPRWPRRQLNAGRRSLSKARQVTGPRRTGTLPCLPASPGSPASPATPVPW